MQYVVNLLLLSQYLYKYKKHWGNIEISSKARPGLHQRSSSGSSRAAQNAGLVKTQILTRSWGLTFQFEETQNTVTKSSSAVIYRGNFTYYFSLTNPEILSVSSPPAKPEEADTMINFLIYAVNSKGHIRVQ